jgi:hypothetical protein
MVTAVVNNGEFSRNEIPKGFSLQFYRYVYLSHQSVSGNTFNMDHNPFHAQFIAN